MALSSGRIEQRLERKTSISGHPLRSVGASSYRKGRPQFRLVVAAAAGVKWAMIIPRAAPGLNLAPRAGRRLPLSSFDQNRKCSVPYTGRTERVGVDKGQSLSQLPTHRLASLGVVKMNRLTVMAMIFCSSLAVLVGLPKVMADEWNKKTIVTFGHPVEIPGGKILPAGRYVFKLMDLTSDRNIVQIFNEDQTHLYANIIAIPNYRLRPTDETVITFMARAPGSPEASGRGFIRGLIGARNLFIQRQGLLAREANKKARSLDALQPESNITRPAKSVNEPPIMALKKAPLKAVKPTGEAVAITEITVWGPVQARPEASPVVDPTSSIKIPTIRPHNAWLLRVRIVVAIILSLILAVLVVFFARSFRSTDWRGGTAKVAPPGFPRPSPVESKRWPQKRPESETRRALKLKKEGPQREFVRKSCSFITFYFYVLSLEYPQALSSSI